jgi:hypothetical protein
MRRFWLPLVLVLLACVVMPPPTQGQTPDAELSTLARELDAAITAVERGDASEARAALRRFNDGWATTEDAIRLLSRSSYRAIE